jgi:hypothetical protein
MGARRDWRLVLTGESSAEPVRAHQPFGSAWRYEAMIWRELALGLVINRRVPEYFDDDTVSQELRRVWRDYWLPWEISEQEMESMCRG